MKIGPAAVLAAWIAAGAAPAAADPLGDKLAEKLCPSSFDSSYASYQLQPDELTSYNTEPVSGRYQDAGSPWAWNFAKTGSTSGECRGERAAMATEPGQAIAPACRQAPVRRSGYQLVRQLYTPGC